MPGMPAITCIMRHLGANFHCLAARCHVFGFRAPTYRDAGHCAQSGLDAACEYFANCNEKFESRRSNAFTLPWIGPPIFSTVLTCEQGYAPYVTCSTAGRKEGRLHHSSRLGLIG